MGDPPALRWRLVVAGVSLGVFAWLLALSSSGWPAPQSGVAVTLADLWPYWVGFALAGSALGVVAVTLWRRPATDADAASFGHAAIIILLVGLLARVLVTATTSPVLSDDIWRYILDGRVLAAGDNPYRLSPHDRAEELPARLDDAVAHARTVELVQRVNHPHLVTIYQPLSQWTFALLYQAGGMASNPFRLGFSLLDMGAVALLLLALRAAGASPWWAALYAWHPLAISETAGSGHQDVLGILPLLAALLLTERLIAARRYRDIVEEVAVSAAVGGLLAMAVAVKPVVVPLALPLAWRIAAGRSWRGSMVTVAVAGLAGVAVLTALYLPFAWMDGGIGGMLQTGRTFIDAWSFNGSVHAVLSATRADPLVADAICGALLLIVLVTALALRLDVVEIAITYLFASLLLSSTVHPWYLLWALALTPLRPRFALTPAVWVWSLTISWSYSAHLWPDYRLPAGVAALEYLPVYAALAAGAWAVLRRGDRAEKAPLELS